MVGSMVALIPPYLEPQFERCDDGGCVPGSGLSPCDRGHVGALPFMASPPSGGGGIPYILPSPISYHTLYPTIPYILPYPTTISYHTVPHTLLSHHTKPCHHSISPHHTMLNTTIPTISYTSPCGKPCHAIPCFSHRPYVG